EIEEAPVVLGNRVDDARHRSSLRMARATGRRAEAIGVRCADRVCRSPSRGGMLDVMDDRPESAHISRTDDEWRQLLSPESFAVLRRAATERAWTGALLQEDRAGIYTCGACGNELFKSGTKFDSGCGWPSFYEAVDPSAVTLLADHSLGEERTEV